MPNTTTPPRSIDFVGWGKTLQEALDMASGRLNSFFKEKQPQIVTVETVWHTWVPDDEEPRIFKASKSLLYIPTL